MAARFIVQVASGGTVALNGSTTTNIGSASGGSGGASYPTSADTLTADSASRTGVSGNYTITVSGTNNWSDFSVSAPSTSGNVTLGGTTTVSLFGSFALYSAMTLTWNGTASFVATATGKTINFAGKNINDLTITFAGVGGGWTLAGDIIGTNGGINLTNGALDTSSSNYALTQTTGVIDLTGALARSLTLNNSTITCDRWRIATATNLTFNAGTSSISITGTTSDGHGGLAYYDVTLASFAGVTATNSVTIASGESFHNLTITGGGVTTGTAFLGVGANVTISGTFTANGTNATTRYIIYSTTPGTQRTITANAVSISNCDFQDIIGAGAATWSGTSLANGGNNSGITFTTPVTRYLISVGTDVSWGTTANIWSTSSGGSGGASVPLIHDTAVIDTNSFNADGRTLTIDRNVGTVDFSLLARPLTVNITIQNRAIFGAWTGNTSITHSTTVTLQYRAVGGSYAFDNKSLRITTAGMTVVNALTKWAATGGGGGGGGGGSVIGSSIIKAVVQ